MNTEATFKVLLTTTVFGTKSRNTIIKFCCATLTELANLPKTDLDAGISNLHRFLSNVNIPCDHGCLPATKTMTLHVIRTHFLDRLECNASLETTYIVVLILDNIKLMRDDYIESIQLQAPTSFLEAINIPKFDNKNWQHFESAGAEYSRRTLG